MARRIRGPSIRDVAKAAGVSTSTVSRVLLNEDNVSEETRAAVTRAIDEIGYVPDLGARGLRSGRTRSIGICVADLRYPAFTDFVRAFGDVVDARHYPLLVADAMWDADIEGLRIRELLARRVDALVSLYPQDFAHLEMAKQVGVQVLSVPRSFEAAPPSVARLVIEDRSALAEMMARLRTFGHRRVHYVTRMEQGRERSDYLSQIASEHQLELVYVPVDPNYVRFVTPGRRSINLVEPGLLASGEVTSLFLAQHIAVPVLDQVQQGGLRIPDDISVVIQGHLDWSRVFTPALDSIESDFSRLGQLGGHAVLDLLEERNRPMQLGVNAEYVVGGSSGKARTH